MVKKEATKKKTTKKTKTKKNMTDKVAEIIVNNDETNLTEENQDYVEETVVFTNASEEKELVDEPITEEETIEEKTSEEENVNTIEATEPIDNNIKNKRTSRINRTFGYSWNGVEIDF